MSRHLHESVNVSVSLDNYRPFLFMKIAGVNDIFSYRDERDYTYTDKPNKTFINEAGKIDLFGYICEVIEYDRSNDRYVGYNREDQVFIVINNDNEMQYLLSAYKEIATYSYVVSFHSTSLDNINRVIDLVDEAHKKNHQLESNYFIGTSISLFGLTSSVKEKVKFKDIAPNYNQETLDGLDIIFKTLDSGEAKSGRMAILSGPPGTGKSACLTGVTSAAYEMGYRIVYASTYNVFKDSDAFDTECKTLFVFDDVSWMSSNKISEDAKAYFLDKFTDVNGSRDFFIFSTNDALYNLDAALTRPGRCFQAVEFKELPKAKFKDVVKVISNKTKVNEKKVLSELNKHDSLTLAQIYQLVLTGTMNQIDTSRPRKQLLTSIKGLGD